jgi:hypothetical protein
MRKLVQWMNYCGNGVFRWRVHQNAARLGVFFWTVSHPVVSLLVLPNDTWQELSKYYHYDDLHLYFIWVALKSSHLRCGTRCLTGGIVVQNGNSVHHWNRHHVTKKNPQPQPSSLLIHISSGTKEQEQDHLSVAFVVVAKRVLSIFEVPKQSIGV